MEATTLLLTFCLRRLCTAEAGLHTARRQVQEGGAGISDGGLLLFHSFHKGTPACQTLLRVSCGCSVAPIKMIMTTMLRVQHSTTSPQMAAEGQNLEWKDRARKSQKVEWEFIGGWVFQITKHKEVVVLVGLFWLVWTANLPESTCQPPSHLGRTF